MNARQWLAEAVDETFLASPKDWLASRMNEGMPYLLAHADDGVIWGKRQAGGSLKLSGTVFGDADRYPAIAVGLDIKTLQQARVFGPEAELLVWRTDDGFVQRLIDDGRAAPPECFEEWHLLWGVGGSVESREGFTLLQEGQRGQRHAPPIVVADVRNARRPALRVRHYVAYDGQDQAYIAISRLAGLRE